MTKSTGESAAKPDSFRTHRKDSKESAPDGCAKDMGPGLRQGSQWKIWTREK
jgi:hypothetical protein